MKFKSYPKYKPSGVEWLGDVPGEWEFFRAKWLFNLMSRPPRDTDSIVTAFRDGTVTLRKNRREDGFTNSIKEIGYQGVRKDDLVIHVMDAFAGAVGVSDSDGKSTPVYSVCTGRRPEVDTKYYARFLRHMALTGFISSLSKGIRERSSEFRFKEFAELLLPLPPKPVQLAINSFLDRETAKIDTLIAKQEKLIELLKEKRQAVISHAVTKGLDPTVPMRPSGIEWLGDVPKHWQIQKLGRIAKIGNGSTPLRDNPSYWEGGSTPWLNSSVVNNEEVADASDFVTDVALSECHLPLVMTESVLIGLTGQGKTRGMAALLPFKSTINQHLAYVTPERVVLDSLFLLKTFGAMYRHLRFLSDSEGSTKGALTCDALSRLMVPTPPLVEQQAIIQFLQNVTAKVDALIAKAEQAITLQKEHRTALISAAVTGKIDVREAASELQQAA